MNKAEKEFLADVFGTTLNMPAEKVESLFTQKDPKSDEFDLATDAKKLVLDANVERVKGFKDKQDTEFKNGFKKAKAEERSTFEKEIKEKYSELKSDKVGLELIDDLVSLKAKAPEIEADKVKLHPEYLNLEKTLNNKLKETETALNKKFTDREEELAKAQVFSNVTKKAQEHLKKLNPILPSDQAKADRQLQLLYSDLKKYGYTDNKGELVIMGEDGKRLEDEHGKPISFEALVAKRAGEYWDFAEGDDRSGAGASNDAAAKAKAAAAGKKWEGKVPSNDEEFSKEFAKLSGSEHAEKRVQLLDAYEESQKT